MHVLDASRAVPVTSSLLSEDGKAAFVKQLREDYEKAPRHTRWPASEAAVARSRPRQRAEAEV